MNTARRITDPKIAKPIRELCRTSHAYFRALNEAEQCETCIGPCLNIWIRPSESITGVAAEIMVQLKDVEYVRIRPVAEE